MIVVQCSEDALASKYTSLSVTYFIMMCYDLSLTVLILVLQTMVQEMPRSNRSTSREHRPPVKLNLSSLAILALPLVVTVSSSLGRPQRVNKTFLILF